jgi:hypothetical protein
MSGMAPDLDRAAPRKTGCLPLIAVRRVVAARTRNMFRGGYRVGALRPQYRALRVTATAGAAR